MSPASDERPVNDQTAPDRPAPDHAPPDRHTTDDVQQGPQGRLALVTGATGYIGGELVPKLLESGWRVRVLSRSAAKVRSGAWGDAVTSGHAAPGQVEVVEGDASDQKDLHEAMQDVDVAWYLLHSMGDGSGSFTDAERDMATAFARAAADAHIGRIVYLGGLHPAGQELSEHLSSRVEVGRILLDSGVPTAVLQAGVVLGSGSQSFVMLRHLAERLPGATGPRWLQNRIQPIAVDDVLHYLVAAADLPPEVSREFDVAGPDVLTYGDMLRSYARAVGLGPRPVVTAPVTTPRSAARWVSLVTPVRYELARPLVGSLLNEAVASESDLSRVVGEPHGGATSFTDAVQRAVAGMDTRRWHRTLALTSAAVTVTAAVGVAATDPDSRWYQALHKPSWQPPPLAFPLVWTPLYADIAAISALCLADLAEEGELGAWRRYAAALGVNLALNAGWSLTFFRSHRLTPAVAVAAALAASSADLVRRTDAVGRERAVVLSPYAAWTGFATVLTAAIRRLNRN